MSVNWRLAVFFSCRERRPRQMAHLNRAGGSFRVQKRGKCRHAHITFLLRCSREATVGVREERRDRYFIPACLAASCPQRATITARSLGVHADPLRASTGQAGRQPASAGGGAAVAALLRLCRWVCCGGRNVFRPSRHALVRQCTRARRARSTVTTGLPHDSRRRPGALDRRRR